METIAIRKNNILVFKDGKAEAFKSINKAKKASLKIQKENGGLGRGSVIKGA